GGPPCQSFSLMGRRDPDDPNGGLVFTFLEIVKAKCPLAFVMENVPGMAASKIDGMRLPDVLTLQFKKLGYKVVKLRLAASEYLVPQARKRLLLIGCASHVPQMVAPDVFATESLGVDR